MKRRYQSIAESSAIMTGITLRRMLKLKKDPIVLPRDLVRHHRILEAQADCDGYSDIEADPEFLHPTT